MFVGTGGVVGAYTGLADVGTATMTECVTIAGWIADTVSIPVIIDGDTGHGGIMAVRRLVRESIRAGLAGIRIDDQPIEGKRKTQNAGIEIVPIEQAIARYRAAVDMKNELDPELRHYGAMLRSRRRRRDARRYDCTHESLSRSGRGRLGAIRVPPLGRRNPAWRARLSKARSRLCAASSGAISTSTSISALGVTIAWYPGFSHAVTWAALWDFMTEFQAHGTKAWDDFVASRRVVPIRGRRCRTTAKATPSSRSSNGAISAINVERVMARDGYRIFDSDTHVGPDAGILSGYLERGRKRAPVGLARV